MRLRFWKRRHRKKSQKGPLAHPVVLEYLKYISAEHTRAIDRLTAENVLQREQLLALIGKADLSVQPSVELAEHEEKDEAEPDQERAEEITGAHKRYLEKRAAELGVTPEFLMDFPDKVGKPE